MEIWKEVGCEKCKFQGTKGRKAVWEILFFDDVIRSAVLDYLEKNELRKSPTSKNKTIYSLFLTFLKNHPILSLLLRQILGL